MKKFYLPKDNFLKMLFFMLFLFMLVLYIANREPFELFIMGVSVVAYLVVYSQRDISIEVDDKSIKIIKLPSKILRQTEEEVLFSDIIRINQNSSKSQNLVQIRRKNGPDIYIPLNLNPDFDKYIFELDAQIRKENPEYREDNIKRDKAAEVYRLLAIITFILSCIADLCIIIFAKGFGTFELIWFCCSFIVPFIFIMLYVTHR